MGIVQVIIDRTTSMVIEGIYEFDRPDGGTLVAPSGASFPSIPVAGEWFWRTDESKLYRRDDANANWVSSGGGITKDQHDALRSLIHFLEDGPAEQFASGAYCETLPVGDPFPTSCIWWTTSGKTAKIVEEAVAWNVNKTINTDLWKMYDVDGSTVLVTVTDTFDYTGGNFLTPKRTRTIA